MSCVFFTTKSWVTSTRNDTHVPGWWCRVESKVWAKNQMFNVQFFHNVTEKNCAINQKKEKKTKEHPVSSQRINSLWEVLKWSSATVGLLSLPVSISESRWGFSRITRGLSSFFFRWMSKPAPRSAGWHPSHSSCCKKLLFLLRCAPIRLCILGAALFAVASLRAGNMRRGPGRRGLGRALVGAQHHLVLGGAFCATVLLVHQELFESAGGEGESLPPQLHQVGVLQPGLREAVSGRRTSPENTNTQNLKETRHVF